MTSHNTSAAITLGEALGWIAEIFEESRVAPDTPRSRVPAWDSLGQLVLMAGLDERFGIKMSPDELASLTSVQNILDVLAAHGRLIS